MPCPALPPDLATLRAKNIPIPTDMSIFRFPFRSIAAACACAGVISCASPSPSASSRSAPAARSTASPESDEALARFVGGVMTGFATQAGGGSVQDAMMASGLAGGMPMAVSAPSTNTVTPVGTGAPNGAVASAPASGGGGKPNLLTGSLRNHLNHPDIQIQTMARAAELNYAEYSRTGIDGHYQAHRQAVENLKAMVATVGTTPSLGG